MTEQEHEIKKQLAIHDAKFTMILEEIRQQREDMRRLQDRQDEERRKHDAEMQEMNKKIDENFKTLSNQIHNNFVQTIIGVGAIMAAVGGLIIAALK